MQVSLMNEFLKSYFTFTNIQTREFADFGQISIMERWRYQWISLSQENIIHNGNTGGKIEAMGSWSNHWIHQF